MSKLGVFNFISLNGCYKGPGGDLSWHEHGGDEEVEFSSRNANGGGIMLFGRVTYEMMVAYWTTPEAHQRFPAVAEGMNKADKIVFSRTLKRADWNNTRLIKDNLVDEIRRLKETGDKDMTILGSGTIVTQCAEAGLIDTCQLLVTPVVISGGTCLFSGIKHNVKQRLTSTRVFKSGKVLLCYETI